MSDQRNELTEFVKSAADVSILIAARSDATVAIRRLALDDEVAELFRSAALAYARRLQRAELLPFDPSYPLNRAQAGTLQLGSSAELLSTLNLFRDPLNIQLLVGESGILDHLSFYVLALQGENDFAFFFRVFSPKRELTRTNKIAAILKGEKFVAVKQNGFLFDDDFDCVIWRGTVFVTNVGSFARIFDYYRELRRRAEGALDSIETRIPISNFDDFKDACIGQPQMLAKLAAVSQRSYFASLTFADIKRTINEFSLDVEVVADGSSEALVFDPRPQRRWLIPHLLDDDYLRSLMTGSDYEAGSKVSLK
jgi:hypothetical protein